MFRIPAVSGRVKKQSLIRSKSSSSFIRSTFIEYFKQNDHKHLKSSPVVPLCDPTVPFVNAGMNQFKGVFLGTVKPPSPRVVNSQKCVRVGGKHNDLDVVGTDGHHHTFFEMLGNWSFGDYYKKEACQMAWDLLLGPYRLKPENLVVTYFAGDVTLNLTEDRECRDIWKDIGVPASRLKSCGAADNFWEMGTSGPCGPCTEIHYVNPDGSLTEIWNLVFIQCHRESDGSIKGLRCQHVDTGMGLERLSALLQGVPSNYDTDLFQPVIKAIEKHSTGVPAYAGSMNRDAFVDIAYRRLADHARMISVCLADGVYPANSVNLKQIMRKSFKISNEIFKNPNLLRLLYDQVSQTLGDTYPELITKAVESKLILEHEQQAYERMKGSLNKKWKELVKQYPEVEQLSDVETPGFAQGYKEFKETMKKAESTVIPGELMFKLYDTHGFQEDIIDRIADLNKCTIDKNSFHELLAKHKARHQTSFKEQTSNRGLKFDKTIDKIIQNGVASTNDTHKYEHAVIDNKIVFNPLKTSVVAILNEKIEWIDYLEPSENRLYYIVTKDTNFYCEEGGQMADSGIIRVSDELLFNVDSVFKIKDFVFHKGTFTIKSDNQYVNFKSDVTLEIDCQKRTKIMRNHTAVHLLNAAVRKVLSNSVVCQIGSSVTDKGLSLNLSVYGEKLSQKVIKEAQDIIRKAIRDNLTISTRVVDGVQLNNMGPVVTVPGETYPETGLRLVETSHGLISRELCCGTHVPSTGLMEEFFISTVKAAGSNSPAIHALTGDDAKQARELFCHVQRLDEVTDILEPERKKQEVSEVRRKLAALCGASGAPYGEYADCLNLMDKIMKRQDNKTNLALQAIAEEEIREVFREAAAEGRSFVVHFLRCSYLMNSASVCGVLKSCPIVAPALLVGCEEGVLTAAATVPPHLVTVTLTASRWLGCITPVFNAQVAPQSTDTYAQMTPSKASLITCEQLVQDAMRVAIKYAQAHIPVKQQVNIENSSKDRRHN